MPGPVNLWDRPSVAIANLLRGELRAAFGALARPSKLAPEHTETLAELVAKREKTDPLLAGIATVVTDPLFIVGMALSMKYPVAKMKDLFKVGQKWAVTNRRLGWFDKTFLRGEAIFAGTKVPKYAIGVLDESRGMSEVGLSPLAKILEKLKKSLGRDPTTSELQNLWAKCEGLDKGIPPLFKAMHPYWKTPFSRKPLKLTGPFATAYHELRGKGGYTDFVFEKIVKPLAETKGGQTALKLQVGLPVNAPDIPMWYLKESMPHILLRSISGEQAYLQMLAEVTKADPGQFARLGATTGPGQLMPAPLYKRIGILVPEIRALKSMPWVNPKAIAELTEGIAMRTKWLDVSGKKFVQQMLQTSADEQSMFKHVQDFLSRAKGTPWEKRFGVALRPDAFRAEAQHLATALAERHKGRALDALARIASGSADIAQYPLTPFASLTNYVQSLTRPYAWHVKGYASKFKSELQKLKRVNPQAATLLNEYLPILAGRTNARQTQHVASWNAIRMNTIDRLRGPFVSKLVNAGVLPAQWRDWLTSKLMESRGPFSYVHAMNKTASYFYFSTIAGNVSSAFKNSLQTLIGTIPLAGTGATGRGFASATKKMQRYFNLRFPVKGKGLNSLEAMKAAFPEFSSVPTLAPSSSLSQNIIRGTLEEAWRTAGTSSAYAENLRLMGYGKSKIPGLDVAKKIAMGMFSGTETWNRLVAFESGLQKGVGDGLKVWAAKGKAGPAITEAAKLVRMGQYAIAPMQMPHGILNIPAPFRQYLYFPMRFLGQLVESTRMPWAGMSSEMMTSRNWGPIGRTLAASSVGYHGAKAALGMDVSGGLLTGALPLPQVPSSPFYPFPMVPPIFSIPGGVVQGIATEETEPLTRAGALLTPLGVPMFRALRTWLPKYAKYDQRLPDGRIPLHSGSGAMVAAYTPFQMTMRSLGLNTEDVVKEREMASYLLSHRDQIRDMRRRFVNATYENDPAGAQKVAEEFKRTYPSLGPLEIKPSDMEAAQRRAELTRLQRLLETFPTEYRAYFQDIVSAALANQMGNMFPATPAPGPAGVPMTWGPAGASAGFSSPYSASLGGETSPSPFPDLASAQTTVLSL